MHCNYYILKYFINKYKLLIKINKMTENQFKEGNEAKNSVGRESNSTLNLY